MKSTCLVNLFCSGMVEAVLLDVDHVFQLRMINRPENFKFIFLLHEALISFFIFSVVQEIVILIYNLNKRCGVC